MRIPHILPMLAVALHAAPPVETALQDSRDSAQLTLPVRILEIQDRRVIQSSDAHLLGTIGTGIFEERTALRTRGAVAQEVQQLVQGWTRPTGNELPVRLELLSFEGWTNPSKGPDVAYSRIQFRVVSLDSTRPGVVVTPQARSERKGLQTAGSIAAQLRQGLRDALLAIPTPPKPIPDSSVVIPTPERWVWPDSLPAKPAPATGIRQPVLGQITGTPDLLQLQFRYGQSLENPRSLWQSEYWTGFQWRGPWTDSHYADVWSGDLLAGITWTRRLDAGASPYFVTLGAAGLIGYERYRIVYTDTVGNSHNWTYAGVEGRVGMRYQARNTPGWIWGAGLVSGLRIPSRLAWLSAGAYAEGGYNF